MCCIRALRRGPQAADYCRQHLSHVLAECSKASATPQQALKDTFLRLDAGETRGAGQDGCCRAVRGCASGHGQNLLLQANRGRGNSYSALLEKPKMCRWQGEGL